MFHISSSWENFVSYDCVLFIYIFGEYNRWKHTFISKKIQMSCAFLECLQLMICFKVPFFKTGSRALDQNRAWFDRDKPEGMFQSYSLIIHLLFKFTSFAIEIALQSAVQYEIVFGSLFHWLWIVRHHQDVTQTWATKGTFWLWIWIDILFFAGYQRQKTNEMDSIMDI